MKRLHAVALVLVLLSAGFTAEAQRQRAVRSPAPPCTFSLSVVFANPVPDAGMVRGRIVVSPSSPSCTSWNAYSPVDWITIGPGDVASEAAVTVQANPSSSARAATLRVAGLELVVTQQGKVAPPILDTGLVKNGTFATDLANWGWQDRFPNGTGIVVWSPNDGHGDAGSGSMLLRNTLLSGPGMQKLQCVAVEPGQLYTFGFAYRFQASGAGLMQAEVLSLDSSDCSGAYSLAAGSLVQKYQNGSNAWQMFQSGPFRVGGGAHSALVVFASKTQTNGSFDTFIDDVVMKPE